MDEPLSSTQFLAALQDALQQRGLAVRRNERQSTLIVSNPAGEADETSKLGRLMSPGLRQEVACQRDGSGALWWFWVWSGPTRGSSGELEPMYPADLVEEAADRIARVVSVPFADAGGSA